MSINETINQKYNTPQEILEQYATNNTNFEYISGSRLYKTKVNHSDTDIRGVFVSDIDKHFSILKEDQIQEVIFTGNEDKVLFELSNFSKMIKEQSTNVLEALWVPDDFILKDSLLYQSLRDNKNEFLSPISIDKMLGFSASQYGRAKKQDKKIQGDILEPLRKDYIKLISNPNNLDFGKYGFPIKNTAAFKHPEHPNFFILYDSVKMNNKNTSWITEDNNFIYFHSKQNINEPILAIVEFQSEKFKKDHLSYKNFLDWKKNGNMEKLEIAKKIGFEPKPMMHAIRILYTTKELLETGVLTLPRKESDLLVDIRNGNVSLKDVTDIYNSLNTEVLSLKENSKSLFKPFNDILINEIIRDTYIQHFNLQPIKNKTLSL